MSTHSSAPSDDERTLSFEARWQEWLANRYARALHTAVRIGLVLYPAFAVLDYLLAPPHARRVLIGTRVAFTLVSLGILFGLRRGWRGIHLGLVSSFYLIIAALGIGVMTMFMGGLASPYYAGLILATTAGGLLFLWPTPLVLFTHASLVACFVLPNLLGSRIPVSTTAVSNLFFLVSTSIIAGVGQIAAFRSARDQVRDQLIIERTKADLERANLKLQNLDRTKSQFFANITHELRTPLTMILAPLESMLAGDFGQLTALQRSYLEANWRNGVRLLRLINDLLDLAKLEDGFMRLRIEHADLKALLEEVVAYARPLAARKRLTLDLKIEHAPDQLYVDSEKLERVFVNLLSNALKFTEKGGITISVSGESDAVRIAIEDTGIGMASDQIPMLFTRFNQGDASITRRFGGTGIGLAYAKEIVDLHGGHISVVSEPKTGSCFTVHLKAGADSVPERLRDRRIGPGSPDRPKRRDDQEPVEWAQRLQRQLEYRFAEIDQVTERRLVSRGGTAPANAARVLVVEDNTEILELINLQLRDKYGVLVATDGKQGLEAARRESPDVIVTDFMMPEMDGLSMLKELRADAKLANVPVVMLTARNQLEERLTAREAGADVYLEKPFSPRELEAAIKRLLEKQGRQVQDIMRAHVQGLEIVSAGLAHEIHNPLTFIKNANLLIAENVSKVRDILGSINGLDPERTAALEKAKQRIDRMVESGGRGVQRIEKVVDLIRRYARDGFPTDVSDVTIDEAVAEVSELVAPRVDTDGQVTLDLGAPAAAVRAIPEELNQIIRSLVENACESAGPTGRVEVRTRAVGAQVVIEVIDNGPGIAPENVAKIFSPFFTTKTGSGRGLGLAVVHIVIQRLGGTIDVSSTPGVQTVFRIKLPAVTAEAPPPETPSPPQLSAS